MSESTPNGNQADLSSHHCGDHIHCNGYGMPVDLRTGNTFVCCEYSGRGDEDAPVCGTCGQPLTHTAHGWFCYWPLCSPNLKLELPPECHFCRLPITSPEHQGKRDPGDHQCRNFIGASKS